jgi:hypothetical protein
MRGVEFLLAVYAFCLFLAGFGVYVLIVGRIQASSGTRWLGVKARLSGLLLIVGCWLSR